MSGKWHRIEVKAQIELTEFTKVNNLLSAKVRV